MNENSKADESKKLIESVTAESKGDILLCNSGMDRGLERNIVDLCRARKRREAVTLILVTSGGDADVAFRIARTLQCFYTKFTCVISGWCKSAGTLLTLGANEIAFGVHGELGPLDVQMAKKDELLEVESGLTVMTALTAIHEKTLLAFQHFFIETTLSGGGRLTVQTASEIAVELTCGLFAPISEQIDPIHIGEAFRSMSIAREYGQRLLDKSKNANQDALEKILSGYPSHGFVIDRIEAETIFEKVRECTENEQRLLDHLGNLALHPIGRPLVRFLNPELIEANQNADDAGNEEDKSASDDKPVEETGRDVEATKYNEEHQND